MKEVQNEITTKLSKTFLYLDEKVNEKIRINNALKSFLNEKVEVLNKILPEVEEFLNTHSFSIEKVNSFFKTGMDRFDEPKPGDQLKVDMSLKMIGRRRPITAGWDHYDRSGSSIGQKKATKIVRIVEDGFRNKFGENFGISVNQFSLDEKTGILCDFWVK